MLQLNILMDGFPLDEQSIEHLCFANCSMPESYAMHSKCVTVGRMSESNAGFKKMFDHNNLGDGSHYHRRQKGVEASIGCGPCSVWCRCPKGLQRKLPWARAAHPPLTLIEYRISKSKFGCMGLLAWADSVELGHGLFPGEDLLRWCRVCTKVPYATVAEYKAAKAQARLQV